MQSLSEMIATVNAIEGRVSALEDGQQAAFAPQNTFFIDKKGKTILEGGAPPSVSQTFADESWVNEFDFPGVDPTESVEVLETGGLRFTKALVGRVDFIFTGYRSQTTGDSIYLCGRQKLSVNRANTNRLWGIYHKYIAVNTWSVFRQHLIAEGKNVNWKYDLKSPGKENPNEQELECGLATEGGQPVGAGRIWLLSVLGFGAFMAAMWKQNPDLPAAAGKQAYATQQNSFGNGGHSASEETDSSAPTSNPYASVYVGDPGFTVTNPQVGDTIYEWEVAPIMLAADH